MKIQVKEIVITRGEGLISECGKKFIAKSYAEAEAILSQMSKTAPKTGGYDKTDFIVTFADGETYSGCYDLRYERKESLGEHMRSFLEWYAGMTQNPHCGQAKYDEFMARQSPAEIAETKLFLDTYQIG